MDRRVLSDEEIKSLEPGAAQLVYRHILEGKIGPDILEQALLQVVIFCRMNRRRMDAELFDRLLEKIKEFEGRPIFDEFEDDEDEACRCC